MATTTTHTPGPWHVGGHPRDDSGTNWREVLAPSPFGPAYVCQALEADAQLIAASPELEAELRETALNLWQTLAAARIGNKTQRQQIDFMRGQMEIIEKRINALLARIAVTVDITPRNTLTEAIR